MGIFKRAYETGFDEQAMYFYWLSSLNAIGMKTYMSMQSFYASPKDVFDAGIKSWEKTGVFTKAQIKAMSQSTPDTVKRGYEFMQKTGIRHITWESDEYPERLRNIQRPPVSLFVKGNFVPNPELSVAVIGTRECSAYGTQVAEAFGEVLAAEGITLISGMARGIDSLSQISSIAAGGYSIAVLGGGCDVVYPRESRALYKELETKGCILSEYAPGTEPMPQFFALRNRLISGLSDVICVVEARLKSGTMITVDSALEQGREVYAVPGRITDRSSRGCHELIKQGAAIVSSPDDFVREITENYGFADKGKGPGESVLLPDLKRKETYNDDERRVMGILGSDSLLLEEIINTSGLGFEKTMSAIESLTMRGIVKNIGAGRFVKDRNENI